MHCIELAQQVCHPRGPNVMARGYLGDPGATAATVDQEGWIHTGDVGRSGAPGGEGTLSRMTAGFTLLYRYDEQGDWFITDRLKELIKVQQNFSYVISYDCHCFRLSQKVVSLKSQPHPPAYCR